ncbi:MAG: hypothetical protein ACI8PB_000025 [Desulforhopalus sp.]|jgi:hypothetical protein
MKLTKHANMRKQQRGIPDNLLDVIFKYGRISNVNGNAYKIFLGNRECHAIIAEFKRGIKEVDRAKGGTIIASGGHIITVYRSNKP